MNSVYITMTIEEIRERWSGKMAPLIATNVAQKDVTFLLGIIEDMKCCGNCANQYFTGVGCPSGRFESYDEDARCVSWELDKREQEDE